MAEGHGFFNERAPLGPCNLCGLVRSAHDQPVQVVRACAHRPSRILYCEGVPYCRDCMTPEKVYARLTRALVLALGLDPCPSGECDPDYPHDSAGWQACLSLYYAMGGNL